MQFLLLYTYVEDGKLLNDWAFLTYTDEDSFLQQVRFLGEGKDCKQRHLINLGNDNNNLYSFTNSDSNMFSTPE